VGSDCEGELHPRALEGIELMNAGRYFEAHEALEAAWRDERASIRELYQGILEAAVVYLHVTRRNYAGALKVYGRSLKWLRAWPETCRGVQVEQLRRDLGAVIAEVERLGEEHLDEFDAGLFKPVRTRAG
jgi:predicted metal-dependent hydrolase